MELGLIEKKKLYPVVQLSNYKKYPVIDWSKQDNWINDMDQLKELRNYTGLSMICGEPSGIMVIDVDKNHGEADGKRSVDGEKSLEKLLDSMPDGEEIKKQIKKTFMVKTPNGGYHAYFKYREGLKSKANYIEGVDIRTDGGLIVVPSSKVKDYEKKRYEGAREYIANCNDIQEIPESLFQKLKELSSANSTNEKVRDINTKKYYQEVKSGEGRNQALISYLGHIIDKNSNMRDIKNLLPQAIMYNKAWFEPPLEDDEVLRTTESALSYAQPPYLEDGGKINIWALVKHVIEENPCYVKGNLLFIYDHKESVYKYSERRDVQRMYFKYPALDRQKTVEHSKKFADLLMLQGENANEVKDERNYINCLNGIVDIESNKLVEHDPKYKLEVKFNANYKEDWRKDFEKSEFKKFINDLLGEGSIETVQEALGLMLSPHAKEVQNCFIYKGEGSNGKSALFEIQEALIKDKEYICGIGLGDFGGEFTLSMAEGKHVNIVRDDELTGRSVNKAFKSMVNGEPLKVNKKNRDEARLEFNMTHFFGLNRLPFSEDKSTGFFRRPIIVPFNTSFGTKEEVEEGRRDKVKDTQIASRIIESELDIVFMWAYEGLRRVKANKWQVTQSEESREEMEEYQKEIDSVYAFYKECVRETDPVLNRSLSVDKVYNEYYNWALNECVTPMGKRQFGRQMSSYGVKRGKSGSVRTYKDIELIEN